MFYVCMKGEGNTFGVWDTEDCVLDTYTTPEMARIVKKFHVDIKGVSFDGNKMKVSVMRPVKFATEKTYIDVDGEMVLADTEADEVEDDVYEVSTQDFEWTTEQLNRGILIYNKLYDWFNGNIRGEGVTRRVWLTGINGNDNTSTSVDARKVLNELSTGNYSTDVEFVLSAKVSKSSDAEYSIRLLASPNGMFKLYTNGEVPESLAIRNINAKGEYAEILSYMEGIR